MSLFGKKSFRHEQTLRPYDKSGVEAVERVLAAAKRVHERFGVTTEAEKLTVAVAIAKNISQFASAFDEANIGILDAGAVRSYQAHRVRPTWSERLGSWNQLVYDFFEQKLMSGLSGQISAWFALLITIPVGFTLLANNYKDGLNLGELHALILLLQLVPLFSLALAAEETAGQGVEVTVWVGKKYAGLHFLLFTPIRLLVVFCGNWFHKINSGREWVTIALEDFNEPISNEVAFKVDQVITVLPEAMIELKVLRAKSKEKSEFFVTVPLGNNGDRLYLWHEAK